MKQSKIIGIILAIANVILIVVCAVLYLKTDRTEPEIEFLSADVVYREGMDHAELLEGVIAYDSKDGDVTDRVVIEKLIDNREDSTVVVFYAVSDLAGNVAKASRVFNAVFDGKDREKELADDAADQLLEAGITAELSGEHISGDEKAATEPTAAPSEGPSQTPTPTQSSTPEPVNTPEPEPTNTPEPVKSPEPTPRPKPTVNPAAPVLSLKVSEIKVNAGQGPAWVDVIGTLKDDKDDYATLFGNLSVSKYDKDKAGTYQVTVSTEDSDGNKSAEVPLIIVVK